MSDMEIFQTLLDANVIFVKSCLACCCFSLEHKKKRKKIKKEAQVRLQWCQDWKAVWC